MLKAALHKGFELVVMPSGRRDRPKGRSKVELGQVPAAKMVGEVRRREPNTVITGLHEPHATSQGDAGDREGAHGGRPTDGLGAITAAVVVLLKEARPGGFGYSMSQRLRLTEDGAAAVPRDRRLQRGGLPGDVGGYWGDAGPNPGGGSGGSSFLLAPRKEKAWTSLSAVGRTASSASCRPEPSVQVIRNRVIELPDEANR